MTDLPPESVYMPASDAPEAVLPAFGPNGVATKAGITPEAFDSNTVALEHQLQRRDLQGHLPAASDYVPGADEPGRVWAGPGGALGPSVSRLGVVDSGQAQGWSGVSQPAATPYRTPPVFPGLPATGDYVAASDGSGVQVAPPAGSPPAPTVGQLDPAYRMQLDDSDPRAIRSRDVSAARCLDDGAFSGQVWSAVWVAEQEIQMADSEVANGFLAPGWHPGMVNRPPPPGRQVLDPAPAPPQPGSL